MEKIQCSYFTPLTLDTVQHKLTEGHSLYRPFIGKISLEITQCKLSSKYTLLIRSREVLRSNSSKIHTWWARQIKSRSWRFRNLLTTSAPKVKETPRSFSPQPCTSLSGSDHSRSQSKPSKDSTSENASLGRYFMTK